jgi:biotin carboxylase
MQVLYIWHDTNMYFNSCAKKYNKDMKAIQITPHTKKVEAFARTVNAINEFQILGFKTRAAFIEIVQEYDDSYKDFTKGQKLTLFWNARHVQMETILELESIIDRLKSE